MVDDVSPKPEDVADLMTGWASAYQRLLVQVRLSSPPPWVKVQTFL